MNPLKAAEFTILGSSMFILGLHQVGSDAALANFSPSIYRFLMAIIVC